MTEQQPMVQIQTGQTETRPLQTEVVLNTGNPGPKDRPQMTALVGVIHHHPHSSSYFLETRLVYPGRLSS